MMRQQKRTVRKQTLSTHDEFQVRNKMRDMMESMQWKHLRNGNIGLKKKTSQIKMRSHKR